MGFTTPTEIQVQSIPVLLKNKDLIGQAGTGTGKTAAFAIPTIERLDPKSKDIQALILCPTRELAVQVAEQFKLLMKHHQGLSCLAIYGGQSINTQFSALRRGAQVVIGTPGRITDHMRRGTIKFNSVKFLILDEADRMLDMGFEEDIEEIIKQTPKDRQTVMFSATMQAEILKLTSKYLKQAQHINVIGAGKAQSTQITQSYFEIKNKSKIQALKRLLAFHKVNSALVFCNTKARVDDLCRNLKQDGFAAGALHGDLRQNKRDAVMKDFRDDIVRILVATDVAARGIDVENVEAVFNYDLPRDDEDYMHRIGRTGRAGKTGLALSFIVGSEKQHIERIARRNNTKITLAKIPKLDDLELNSSAAWQSVITESALNSKTRKHYLKIIRDLEAADNSVEVLSGKMLKIITEEEPTSILGQDVDFGPETSKGGDSRSFGGRSSGGRSSGGAGRSGTSRGFRSGGSGGARGFGGKSSGGGARSFGAKSSGGGARGNRNTSRSRDDDSKSERKSYSRDGEARAPRKSYGERDGEARAPRKSYSRDGAKIERKSYSRDGEAKSERRSFGERDGEARAARKSFGERNDSRSERPYDGKPRGAEDFKKGMFNKSGSGFKKASFGTPRSPSKNTFSKKSGRSR